MVLARTCLPAGQAGLERRTDGPLRDVVGRVHRSVSDLRADLFYVPRTLTCLSADRLIFLSKPFRRTGSASSALPPPAQQGKAGAQAADLERARVRQ